MKMNRTRTMEVAGRIKDSQTIRPSRFGLVFSYDQLRVDVTQCLDSYITSGKGTLDELKDRFRSFLFNGCEEIHTINQLLNVLETREAIGENNVELLKMLAQELEIPEMMDKLKKFERNRTDFRKWNMFQGGVNTAATSVKNVLSATPVLVVIAGIIIIYILRKILMKY